MPAVSKLLKPCSELKSTICGRTLVKKMRKIEAVIKPFKRKNEKRY
jgi:hypothetical protein